MNKTEVREMCVNATVSGEIGQTCRNFIPAVFDAVVQKCVNDVGVS